MNVCHHCAYFDRIAASARVFSRSSMPAASAIASSSSFSSWFVCKLKQRSSNGAIEMSQHGSSTLLRTSS